MKIIWITFCLLAVVRVSAETNAPPRRGPPVGWSQQVQARSIYQFDSNLDEGGDFSVSRSYAAGGLAYAFRPDRMVSVSLGYGRDEYHFSDAAEDPWGRIEQYRASLFTRWGTAGGWTFFGGPSLRVDGEQGADLDEAWSAAFFGGASYRFSDRLSIGPGFGVAGQLEDDTSYFPIILVDWKITDQLRLKTGGGQGASGGPGLSLNYMFSRQWSMALTGMYEKKRFRISGRGNHSNGIGEDRSVLVLGSIVYNMGPVIRFGGLFGSSFAGKLRVESSSGHLIEETKSDPAAVVGLFTEISF